MNANSKHLKHLTHNNSGLFQCGSLYQNEFSVLG